MFDPTPLSLTQFIRGVRILLGREMSAYFDSPIAYVYATVFLVLSSTIFMNSFFLDGVVDITPYFEVLPYLLIPFIPAITMRSWAEERAQNTIELVMTLPLHSSQIVLGKYLAAVCFYGLVLTGSLPIVIMLFWLGDPDPGLILSNYLGALMLGALILAIGLYASSLTSDQIVAFVVAGLLAFTFVFTGHEKVVEVIDGLAPSLQFGTWLYDSFSIMPHYKAFTTGLIALAHTLYFLLLSAFFLWMNQLTLQRSRY